VTAVAVRALAAAALGLLLLAMPAPAGAVYKCGDQKDDCKCGKNNPYPCCSNGGNCTWWAWEGACCNWKVGLPGWGNAKQWAGNAKANASYEVKSSPVAGSIGVRVTGSYGHVVWVKSVSGSKVTVTEMACWGFYGMRTHTYSASYFDGGFIVRKGSSCQCTAGKKDTRTCGACGKQSRTCSSSCKWGSWGSCSGQGACSAGKKDTRVCGKCGKQSRTCSKSCAWGSWGSCGGEGACSAGKKETRACGKNGQQSRTCSKSCAWGSWGSCVERDGGVAPADQKVGGKDLRPGHDSAGDVRPPWGQEWGTAGPDLPGGGKQENPYTTLSGGCAVGGAGGGWIMALLALLLLGRRRRS